MEPIKGISRVDNKTTHGWLVRHYVNGFTFSRLFSDLKNKNRETALIKAMVYQLDREVKIIKKRHFRAIQSNNTSGISGVSVSTKTDSKGKSYVHYISTWINPDGTLKTRSFSSKKYGKRNALKLAEELRSLMTSNNLEH